MLNNSEVITNGVSCKRVIEFFDNCKKKQSFIHRLSVYKDGLEVVRAIPKPYSVEDKAQVYSISKSFTSTAVGLLFDEGKIDPSMKIVDIFADRIKTEPCENMKKIQVKHLLSMNTGHEACILMNVKKETDPVSAWLASDVKYEPGTHFVYNNSATFMLSEIVTHFTGMSMYDYINMKFFSKVGMKGIWWDSFPCGETQAAVGIHIGIDDLAKLGLMYLNGGVCEGKRILSEEWVRLATSKQTDNSQNGTKDWASGYGFQFWMNEEAGFRGDGASGQLCVVLPEKNMVAVVQALSWNMQDEMDEVFVLCNNLFEEDNLKDADLKEYLENYSDTVTTDNTMTLDDNAFYIAEKNIRGISNLRFCLTDELFEVYFSNGEKIQKMSFGKNEFAESNIQISWFKTMLDALMLPERIENNRFAGKFHVYENVIEADLLYLDNPFMEKMYFEFSEDKKEVNVTLSHYNQKGDFLKAKIQ